MNILKKLRTERGYNQQKLAELLCVSRSTIAMWETEKAEPNIELLLKLAEIFNVSIDYLLGKTDFSAAENIRICQNVTRLCETIKNPPNTEGIIGITQPLQQIKKNEYQFTHEALEQFASYFGVSVDNLLVRTQDNSSHTITPQISKQEKLLLKECTDLTDDERQEVLNFIRFKKTQKEKPFTSSNTRSFTTANFEDNTERIAAFGGMDDAEDEPLTT